MILESLDMIKFSKYYIRQELCKGCLVCLKICPQKAIIKNSDNKPEIIQEKCDGCGLCKERCKLRVIIKRFGLRIK